MSPYKHFKKRVYKIIGPTQHGDKLSTLFDICLCALVLLSGVAVIIELFNIPDGLRHGLEIFEYVTVAIFIVEYIVRLWVCEFEYPECKNKIHAIWEFVTSFDSLVDIISIASIIFNGIPKEFAILRLIKLVKLVRLVKMSGYIKTSEAARERKEKIKIRVNEVIDKGRDGDLLSKIYDTTSIILIFISVSFILVETFPIPAIAHKILFGFEVVIASLFAVEYVLRVWTAPLDYPELRPDKARMRYIFSFMSLIDLLSIVPVFVADLPTATGILKIFKLCKILRLLKASRYLNSIANFGHAIQRKKKQIIMSLVAMTVMIMICSVLMYSFESKEQPDVFTNGFSGVYYSFQTMIASDADIEPVTPIGQTLATLMMLLGGCMIGVPVAIVATGFEDMIAEQAGEEPEENTEIYETLKLYDGLSESDKARFKSIIEIETPDDKFGEEQVEEE
ncbi:MAG: ion transporter [Clostridia bacterium]|nr:ion transporter [Clostridia bacterium]